MKAKVATLLMSYIYKFLVADYLSSTANGTTCHFDTSVKYAPSYWLATLQHILCIHSTFDGNGTSLQDQLISLKKLWVVFLAPTQLK